MLMMMNLPVCPVVGQPEPLASRPPAFMQMCPGAVFSKLLLARGAHNCPRPARARRRGVMQSILIEYRVEFQRPATRVLIGS